jgi:hypothetical protein
MALEFGLFAIAIWFIKDEPGPKIRLAVRVRCFRRMFVVGVCRGGVWSTTVEREEISPDNAVDVVGNSVGLVD